MELNTDDFCFEKSEIQFKSLKLVEPIGEPLDLQAALADLDYIMKRHNLGDERWQVSLTHPSITNQSIEDGVGSLFDAKDKRWMAEESDFKYFSNEFKHTYFHTIYQKAQEWSGGRIGRMRLMSLPPRCCYSFHKDPSSRLHLVLKTNSQSLILFPYAGLYRIPNDGCLYRVETRLFHTAINGGEKSRIHLVLSYG